MYNDSFSLINLLLPFSFWIFYLFLDILDEDSSTCSSRGRLIFKGKPEWFS